VRCAPWLPRFAATSVLLIPEGDSAAERKRFRIEVLSDRLLMAIARLADWRFEPAEDKGSSPDRSWLVAQRLRGLKHDRAARLK